MSLFSSTYNISIEGNDFLVVFGGWSGNKLVSITNVATGKLVTDLFMPFTKDDLLKEKRVSASASLFGSGQNISRWNLDTDPKEV